MPTCFVDVAAAITLLLFQIAIRARYLDLFGVDVGVIMCNDLFRTALQHILRGLEHAEEACSIFDGGVAKIDVAVVCHEATKQRLLSKLCRCAR